jgi:hypothetical protein
MTNLEKIATVDEHSKVTWGGCVMTNKNIIYYQDIPFEYNSMDYNCEYYKVLRDENNRYHLNFFRGLVNDLKLMYINQNE